MILADSPVIEIAAGTVDDSEAQEVYRNLQVLYGTHTGEQAFPKGTNFAAVTNAQIAQAENWINNYPRKILGYKSSEIVFRECLRELGIAA